MNLNSAIAYCQNSDSFKSGEVVASQVMDKMGQKPDFLVLFASIGHDISLLLQGIKSKFEDVPICGCSSFGNITHLGNDESRHKGLLINSKNFQFFHQITKKN
ncbi:MAG: FIST N-terminal domain-containing protein [Cyanobacteria bacterium J06628_3]